MGLFNKKGTKAAGFIDYEFWEAAAETVYEKKPDVDSFNKLIREKYDVEKIYYFGRFSLPSMENDVNTIRTAGGEPIDTTDADRIRGDRTDFIMLQYIFEYAFADKNIDTVILFTADNQFMSVMSFLKERKKMKLVISGIKRTLGEKFKQLADDVIEVPCDGAERNVYYDMIIDNFRYIHKHKDKQIYPTFLSTITTVARLNDVPEESIREALQTLIDKKIIYKVEVAVNQGENTVRVLRLDKSKAQKAGLYLME